MHKFTVASNGDTAKALKTAQQLMADRGFAVSKIGGGEVRGTRSHPFFGKKTNDMIALVSKLAIRASSSQVSAEAELGTFKKLLLFLIVLIATTEVALLVVGLLVMDNMLIVWISLATLAPWIVVGPAMLLTFRRLALKEVETLLSNVVAIACEDEIK